MNNLPAIFDLQGPQFLLFYCVLFVLSALFGLVLRRFLRGPFGFDQLAASRLEPLDLAYLQGRAPRAFQAALAALLQKEVIHVVGDSISVVYGKASKRNRLQHPLEQEMVRQVDSQKVGRLGDLFTACSDTFATLQDKLERAGMLLTRSSITTMRIVSFLVYAVVASIGGIKIWIGMSRDKPVGFLVALVIVTAVFAVLSLGLRYFRTVRGDATLARVRRNSLGLRATAAASAAGAQTLTANDMALGVALFGLAAMPAVYPDLNLWAKQNKPAEGGGNASCGTSSSCSSGGSSDSGGGGGDSGGGSGCGGCGGGGGD